MKNKIRCAYEANVIKKNFFLNTYNRDHNRINKDHNVSSLYSI